MGKGNCSKDEYFGPLGKCQPCGYLCDNPYEFPDSCKDYCPDYIPKERTTTSELPPSPVSQPSNSSTALIIGGFTSLSSLLLLVFIFSILWKKVLSGRFSQMTERRRNTKLRKPVQARSDHPEHAETVPLSNPNDGDIEAPGDSVIGNSSMNQPDLLDFIRNRSGVLSEAEMSGSSRTSLTISDEMSSSANSDFSSTDFDFGQTFPFHSLSCLKSVFDDSVDDNGISSDVGDDDYRNSSGISDDDDQTRRKTRIKVKK